MSDPCDICGRDATDTFGVRGTNGRQVVFLCAKHAEQERDARAAIQSAEQDRRRRLGIGRYPRKAAS